jgi:pimeloyl-ACP methyl ester carboxylesterase
MIARVMLLIVMLGAALLLIAAATLLLALIILSPPRMTDGKALYLLQRLSPGDLNMHFEPMRFTVRDSRSGKPLDIAAWWIPQENPSNKTVILIHGYADAKVGSIAWAPTWQSLGYHILAIDLRAHGETSGRFTTAGFFERHDIDQIINQLRASHPQQTQKLVLFGISLGAAVALATAALRDDISALVLECPYISFRGGTRQRITMLKIPARSVLRPAMSIAKLLSGADLDLIQVPQLIASAKCPIFVIQSSDDPFVPPADAQAIQAAINNRHDGSECWLVESFHLLALAADQEEYRQRLEKFSQLIT